MATPTTGWRRVVLERLWRFLSRQIVADVPDAYAACQDCLTSECNRDKFEHCEYRLAREAALQARAAQEAKA
jgi:hypothetical protein